MKKYSAEAAIKKLTELVITELGSKQDKMEQITAEEVQQIWDEAPESFDAEP